MGLYIYNSASQRTENRSFVSLEGFSKGFRRVFQSVLLEQTLGALLGHEFSISNNLLGISGCISCCHLAFSGWRNKFIIMPLRPLSPPDVPAKSATLESFRVADLHHLLTVSSHGIVSSPPRRVSCSFPFFPTVTVTLRASTCSCPPAGVSSPPLHSTPRCIFGLVTPVSHLFIISSAKRWPGRNLAPSVISNSQVSLHEQALLGHE